MQTMASDSLNDNSELDYFHFLKNYEFGHRLPANLPFNLPLSKLIADSTMPDSNQTTPATIGASDEHSLIQRKSGTWKATCQYFMGGDANPIEVEGRETGTMLGELWCNSHFEADMMGSPIAGNGSLGYDPVKKKYIFTWNDSTAPFLYLFEGDFDQETNVLELFGENFDPVRQCIATYRSRIEFKNDNEHVVDLSIDVPEGLPIKVLRYEFIRAEQ